MSDRTEKNPDFIQSLINIFEKFLSKTEKFPEIINDIDKKLTEVKNFFEKELLIIKKDYEGLGCEEHRNRITKVDDAIVQIKEKLIPDLLQKIQDQAKENAVRQVYINIGIVIINIIFAAIVAKYIKG